MADQEDFDSQPSRHRYQAPYTSKNPIPTIQKYKAERSELKVQKDQSEEAQKDESDEPTVKRAYHAAKGVLKGEDDRKPRREPYQTENRNVNGTAEVDGTAQVEAAHPHESDRDGFPDGQRDTKGDRQDGKTNTQAQSATEVVAGHSDPRQKRKVMKHKDRNAGGREVTDPVTHLPIFIRDSTRKDLRSAPENVPASGSESQTMTGLSGANKSDSSLEHEQADAQASYKGMQHLFPPPTFDDLQAELTRTYQLALATGLGAMVLLVVAVVALVLFYGRMDPASSYSSTPTRPSIVMVTLVAAAIFGAGMAVVFATRSWLAKKVEEIWNDEVWDAARCQEVERNESDGVRPESVAWLNSLLASVWPLVNPDLFTSISDMLEDVMQASLPRVVRMVSVDDLGQGSEAFRILGIKWLPTGAASRSVDKYGKLEKLTNHGQGQSDRTTPGEGQIESDDTEKSSREGVQQPTSEGQDPKQKEEEQQAIREGMEAEQGDFVNMELAFAYRARSSGKSLQAKAKNAHLYLKFYLPGGVAVPVWVELRGIIGTMRLRLQLTPDPPFFSLCTLTFMGQPQADLSCVPLSKHALNLMDLPLLSSFVQSSIDAALAEYVAPKSMTLDLKDMLIGDDFKKDTVTRGVVMIFIKSAKGFKEGDGGIGPMSGSSDAYVTVSWGKFGKPVASTRIIVEDQNPSWHEWAHILVSPEELNADEKLRLQLWDSDKYTADDDLGRVEVDLRDLMHNPRSKNKMYDREDRFRGEDPEEEMPGTIQWQVGYFAKSVITEEQFAKQTEDPNIRTKDDLKKQVAERAERKLREATAHDESKEIKQQTQEDFKEREDALIVSSPPPADYRSGIFSIQIHNIMGLEVQSLRKRDEKSDQGDREDGSEQSHDLPSSYATIVLNHQSIYRTRTKPKNAKPFFNAGTERFVVDWKTAEVMVSVRDSREREDDSLLGMVYLPLRRVFEKTSQVMQTYPLIGGMGYGRARISMVWRSVDLQLPPELRGWNYGTLEVTCPVKARSSGTDGPPSDSFTQNRMKLRTNLMRVKLSPDRRDTETVWKPKRDKDSVFLAVRKRYSSPLVVEFRQSKLGPDSTTAFAVLWLKDIPDEEEKTVTLKVWKGGKKNAHRATTSYGYEGLEEGEQPLGEIELTLRFWRGLSGYHKSFAKKSGSGDMRNVMEVLDTANDEGQIEDEDEEDDDASDSDDTSASDSDADGASGRSTDKTRHKKLQIHTNDDSSASDSDTGTVESKKDPTTLVQKPLGKAKSLASAVLDVDGHNDADDGSRGLRAQVRDYKDHHKELHRKHRGVMQWQGARTLDWMTGKVKRGKARVGEVFEHREDQKAGGVETEV